EDPYEFIDTHYYPLLDFTKLYSPREAEIREIEYCLHVQHKYYIIGKVVATVVVFVWNFGMRKLLLYRGKPAADNTGAPAETGDNAESGASESAIADGGVNPPAP
ncbi:MAG: hypothetical protein J6V14_09375, partial [Clostridia bacterium]|nr:hypothetical protein [Clostridia bacterium]